MQQYNVLTRLHNTLRHYLGLRWGCFVLLGLGLTLGLSCLFSGVSVQAKSSLPTPQNHPLPSSLSHWTDPDNTGDYFDQVQVSPMGYLVWSHFPVKVYLEQRQEDDPWVKAVRRAIADWTPYIPLVEVRDMEKADIIWVRSRPPLQARVNRETRELEISGARNAETTYEFYLTTDTTPRLTHRMKILLSPHQSAKHTQGTARHEMGHALGIWGHSDNIQDVLYASQVSDPPPISPRDINTLKKIYQQPTKLGWTIR